MMMISASEPANPEKSWSQDEIQNDRMNSPATIDGSPVITSTKVDTSRPNRSPWAVLDQVDRDQQAQGDGDERRDADLLDRADDRVVSAAARVGCPRRCASSG